MNNCDQLKIWQLETKIKRLEGNDLEQIMIDFNNRIDSITKKASFDLDKLKGKIKASQHSISRADFTSQIELLHRELLMLNEKNQSHSYDGQWLNFSNQSYHPMCNSRPSLASCMGFGKLGGYSSLL